MVGAPNATPFVKDAFHEYLVHGDYQTVNPARQGTKAAVLYTRTIAGGSAITLRLRLTKVMNNTDTLTASSSSFADFDAMFKIRQEEADEYYTALQPGHLDELRRSKTSL